jgi:hypothetical protein
MKSTVHIKMQEVYFSIKQSKQVIDRLMYVFDEFLNLFDFDNEIKLLNDDEKYFFSHFYFHLMFQMLFVDKVHKQYRVLFVFV